MIRPRSHQIALDQPLITTALSAASVGCSACPVNVERGFHACGILRPASWVPAAQLFLLPDVMLRSNQPLRLFQR